MKFTFSLDRGKTPKINFSGKTFKIYVDEKSFKEGEKRIFRLNMAELIIAKENGKITIAPAVVKVNEKLWHFDNNMPYIKPNTVFLLLGDAFVDKYNQQEKEFIEAEQKKENIADKKSLRKLHTDLQSAGCFINYFKFQRIKESFSKQQMFELARLYSSLHTALNTDKITLDDIYNFTENFDIYVDCFVKKIGYFRYPAVAVKAAKLIYESYINMFDYFIPEE